VLPFFSGVKTYIKEKRGKIGNVYLAIVHRLDRPVSGVIVFARRSKAAARLSKQFRDGKVEKTYLAIVEGDVPWEYRVLRDFLFKDRQKNIVRVVTPLTLGAREAVLKVQVLSYLGNWTLVQIVPFTGRSHQIRIQLASRGFPIVGDRKYGSHWTMEAGHAIALHAHSLVVFHPITQKRMIFVAPLPLSWLELGVSDIHYK